eukprot:scaffold6994_cov101-Isochrysis_galbana.AAC.2
MTHRPLPVTAHPLLTICTRGHQDWTRAESRKCQSGQYLHRWMRSAPNGYAALLFLTAGPVIGPLPATVGALPLVVLLEALEQARQLFRIRPEFVNAALHPFAAAGAGATLRARVRLCSERPLRRRGALEHAEGVAAIGADARAGDGDGPAAAAPRGPRNLRELPVGGLEHEADGPLGRPRQELLEEDEA